MQIIAHATWRIAVMTGGLSCLIHGLSAPGIADEPAKAPTTAPAQAKATPSEEIVPAVDLLTAVKQGDVSVKAEGIGDGRMTLSVTNKTQRKLKVVLPPGLIASSATGQFGGMGGMGGMGGGPDLNRLKALGGGKTPEASADELKAIQDRLAGLGGGQLPGGLPGLPGFPPKK